MVDDKMDLMRERLLHPDVIAAWCKWVEETGDYRVLRRLKPRPGYHAAKPGEVVHTALFLDLETTSLDTDLAEVIEFGATRFTFNDAGQILTVAPAVSWFEQPSKPIPPEITAVNGITDDMVAGKIIESQWMDELVDGVQLMVAHNADYDRKIAERRWQYRFEHLPWACSQRQIDWKARGAIGAKLPNILMTAMGMFYDAHRADADVIAGVHALTHERMMPVDGDPGAWPQTALAELLETTRSGVFRVYAHESPFEDKELLKSRGYFWTGEKPWKRDFKTRDEADAECEWLFELRPFMRPQIKRINAKHRYSVREEAQAIPLQRRTIKPAAPAGDPVTDYDRQTNFGAF